MGESTYRWGLHFQFEMDELGRYRAGRNLEAQMRLNRKWIIGTAAALVVLTTLSCSFSDLLGATPEIREVEVTRIVTVEPPGPPIDLEGVWLNPVTGSHSTIIWRRGQFEVVSVIDDDGEFFPVTDWDWDGTRIRWSYYVPSTGYNVTFAMTSLVGDSLNCSWFNDHDASGTRTMERQQ
jgi:hypothetical protein